MASSYFDESAHHQAPLKWPRNDPAPRKRGNWCSTDRWSGKERERESERASEREVSCDDGEVQGSKKNTTTNKETTESRRRAMVHLSAFRPHAPGGPRNVVHRPDPRFLQRFTRLEMGSFGCRWIPPAPSGVCATGATKRHGGWQVS